MEPTLAQKAEKFAADTHKGLYGTKPYTHHLKMVIDELLEVIDLIPKQNQDAVIAAAWLHDIMEDEKINNAVLEDEFGKEVSELVWLLTNHTDKRASPEYYEKLKSDPFATIIKLCDRIANVKYSLAGKEKLHPNESDVTKLDAQMRCEHKFSMYKHENDVFVSELKYTESWDIHFKLANDVGFNLDKAISKLRLKLVHLFNQPQIATQQDRKLDISVKFFNYGYANSSTISINLNGNDFTSDEIIGSLTLIVSSFGGIIEEKLKQKYKTNNEQPGTN